MGCYSINRAARKRFEDYHQGTMIAQSCSKNVWDWLRCFSILMCLLCKKIKAAIYGKDGRCSGWWGKKIKLMLMIFGIWENLSARISFKSWTKCKSMLNLSFCFSFPDCTCMLAWVREWEFQDHVLRKQVLKAKCCFHCNCSEYYLRKPGYQLPCICFCEIPCRAL